MLKDISKLTEADIWRRGFRYWFYRALYDDRTVVVKTPAPHTQDVSQNFLLYQEAQLLSLFKLTAGVVKLISIEKLAGKVALILEDAGQNTLADLLTEGPLELGDFLNIAIDLADCIGQIHSFNIIHKDINPTNIVLNSTKSPTFIDFELAALNSRISQDRVPQKFLESLPYQAPEQSGKIGQNVDNRSDLYSIGAIYYQMITGKPPFEESDPLALIHDHLAVIPKPPNQIDPTIPPILSEIILKLLSKIPEDRYQSGEALAFDLRNLRNQWLESRTIQSFELGSQDLIRVLPFPKRLYGREKEQASLESALHRIVNGSCELIFLTGLPGSGKTVLIKELSQKFTFGSIMEGKCDQLGVNIPYGALISACRYHLKEILSQSEDHMSEWRANIEKELVPNAGVLTEVIPELEKLIGPQPPVTILGPKETESRFSLIFQAFIKALSGPNHPLMIFLDDLQWADPALLHLLTKIVTNSQITHLLLVGAYRYNEISANHPLASEIQALQISSASFHLIQIEPLSVDQIAGFLADLLQHDTQEVKPFAEVIVRKTAGNPFFIKRLLRFFQKSGLLFFNTSRNRWTWNIEKIEKVEVTENVVDLMVTAVRDLPEGTQQVLKVAACVGHSFELQFLISVYDSRLKADEAIGLLLPAIRGDIVLPVFTRSASAVDLHQQSTFYEFAHDRVQEAVYSLLSDQEKRLIHLKVGYKLIETLSQKQIEERIFEITDQLNLGSDLEISDESRFRLANFNINAGKKARSTAAFDRAMHYFTRAIHFLDSKGWELKPDLTSDLYYQAVECAYLTNQRILGNELADIAIAHVSAKSEKSKLYDLRIMDATIRGDYSEAIYWARIGLRLFDIELPEEKDLKAEIDAQSLAVEIELAGRSPQELLELPECSNEDVSTCLKLLAGIITVAYLFNYNLWIYCGLIMVVLSLKYGPDVSSSQGYVNFAMYLVYKGEYRKAYEFGQFVVKLVRRYREPSTECEILGLVACLVNTWGAPLRESDALLRTALMRAFESGNLQWVAYIQVAGTIFLYSLGFDVEKILSRIDSIFTFLNHTQNKPMIDLLMSYRQLGRCLKGRTFGRGRMEDKEFDGTLYSRDPTIYSQAVVCYHIVRLQVSYIFGNLIEARDASQTAYPLLRYTAGFFPEIEFWFYSGLTFAGIGDLTKAQESEERLKVWEENCPENFRHKRLILSAEIARLKGQVKETLLLFSQASVGAAREKFIQDEAISYELCGRFYRSLGVDRMAKVCLQSAKKLYSRWGATAKVQMLEEEFSEYDEIGFQQEQVQLESEEKKIDLSDLLNSLETISRELVPNDLIAHILGLGLKITGAQQGSLFIEKDGRFILRASRSDTGTLSHESILIDSAILVAQTVIEYAFHKGKVVVLGNASRDGRFVNDPYIQRHQVKSILALPLSYQHRKMGVLYFENNLSVRAFSPTSVQMLSLLSSQMGVALENSSLFEKMKIEVKAKTQAEEFTRFLVKASESLVESLEYQDTLNKVCTLAVPFLADLCVVEILSSEKTLSVAAYSQNNPAYSELLSRDLKGSYFTDLDLKHPGIIAIQTGEPYFLGDTMEEKFNEGGEDDYVRFIRNLGIRSILSVALKTSRKTIGSITFNSKNRVQIEATEAALAQEFASRCAVAIENAELYSEVQKSIQLRDKFISIVPHELSTPLDMMKVQIRDLKHRLHDRDDASFRQDHFLQIVEGIDQQISQLTWLVEDLLDVSRLNVEQLVLNFEEFDLSELIQDVVERFSEALRNSECSLKLEIEESIWGKWDKQRIEQVFVNLLMHAVRYGKGKSIVVSVSKKSQFAVLNIQGFVIGPIAKDQAYLLSYFENSPSLKDIDQFGLGLYLIRQVVKSHGGKIHLKSEMGKETEFIISLPIY